MLVYNNYLEPHVYYMYLAAYSATEAVIETCLVLPPLIITF